MTTDHTRPTASGSSRRTLRVVVPALLVVGLALAGVAVQAAPPARPGAPAAAAAAADGLDEAANRRQVSLAEAARQPNGPGVVEPAADVDPRRQRRVRPGQLLSRASRAGGCAPGYGTGGECLPPVPPADGAGARATARWTCDAVRELFPDGLAVDGADRLRLDRDDDGVACGRRD